MNDMKKLRIEKITLNIGCGTKTNVEHAKKILEMFSNKKVVITKTKKRSTFNVPKNKPIGCKVTIRDDAEKVLRTLLEAKENKLLIHSFDSTGNFSFGIREYIDIPGMDYDPKIGILGMDVCVTLERPGYRIKRKRLAGKVGKSHLITQQEAVDFVREKFGVAIE
ncbi:MAG: 50S ribosomal protein L5 [Candidatus Aenigmarchaeota archaeon]|nr:50S ribosomal protein L5 [Candidatus Aenigmarchaeota archaeon]